MNALRRPLFGTTLGRLLSMAGIVLGFLVLRAILTTDAAVLDRAVADAVTLRRQHIRAAVQDYKQLGDRSALALVADAGSGERFERAERDLTAAFAYRFSAPRFQVERPGDEDLTRQRWQEGKEYLYQLFSQRAIFDAKLVSEIQGRQDPGAGEQRLHELREFELIDRIATAAAEAGVTLVRELSVEVQAPRAQRVVRRRYSSRSRGHAGSTSALPDSGDYLRRATATVSVRAGERATRALLAALVGEAITEPGRRLVLRECVFEKDAATFLEPKDALIQARLVLAALEVDASANLAEAYRTRKGR